MIAAKILDILCMEGMNGTLKQSTQYSKRIQWVYLASKRALAACMVGFLVSSCTVAALPNETTASKNKALNPCVLLRGNPNTNPGIKKKASTQKSTFSVPEKDFKDYTNHPDYQSFLTETMAMGLSKDYIESALKIAERKKAILEAISRPAEKRLEWGEYRSIFITLDRIEKGKQFLITHHSALQQAEKKYGVPKTVIAAIMGVETWYGGNKGNWRVLDALATLGFDYPPRQVFFREQLQYFLKLSAEQGWKTEEIKGSYAGAMGFPQFMPSSYLDYAVDFNHDSKIDLINDPVDAIGSVGNYLKRFGWKSGEQVIIPAKGPKDTSAIQTLLNKSLKPHQTIEALTSCGITPTTDVEKNIVVTARAFKQNGKSEYWLGMNNFYVISRYNHSALYVMAVHELSEALNQ